MSADANAPWRRYLCTTCGTVYDEAEGDAESGIPPGTRYADLPDDWICPVCGTATSGFEACE